MSLIDSEEGLLKVLKPLLGKNKFLLMFLVSDILGKLIKSARKLSYILSGTENQVDKILFIKRIRQRGLEQIIHNAEDLSFVLEWIYGEGERIILNQFGVEGLHRIMVAAGDIYHVLHFINNENKDYLIELLTFEFIKKKIMNFSDFILVLRGITENMVPEYLKMFPKEQIKDLIDADRQYENRIKKLSHKKEVILLDYIVNS